MNFRHELKHVISLSDAFALRARLRAVAQTDTYSDNGKYEIRSLYFDTPGDRALREKICGVNIREKFRLRCYNHDSSVIKLEKKAKVNGLCKKTGILISREEAERLSHSVTREITKDTPPLLSELYSKMATSRLRPKTIVDYTREAYTYPAGNVRITIDSNIRTGLSCTNFLNFGCVTVPTGNPAIILEVKWDEFLPSVIRDIIQLESRHASAFSKYAVCRIYG